MQVALARHDAIVRAAVEDNHGRVVKMSGDGAHAAFDDPRDALVAALQLLQALVDPSATNGVALAVRCGLHAGVTDRRDGDFFGTAVNRAARIMSVAHGGQTLVSEAVATLTGERLPLGVALRDLGLVRLRGLTQPERVFQLVHPGLRQDFPALRSLESTPNNLPQRLTSFIGRGRELAEVGGLLAKTRLLTLIGVGGIGKTRLSLEVAVDLVDEYPDGVWYVELAPLTDGRLVAQAVASVLGVKEEAGRPVVEALIKLAADRRLLLVLDNCEHLVDACAELASQLLQAGPHLKVLASSREPLRTAGETTYAVPALPTPGALQPVTVERLDQFEAVRLFVERAAAAKSDFRVTARNAAAVADICRRLDGIPLALELAAARARTLPVESIAARLNDRFALLVGGDRTALPRQQTLHALIDWSHELLSERERVLFRRLAVFAGGFALEGAEAMCGKDDGAHVFAVLGQLVEKSLVELDSDGERYRMLETVRQYAQQRLDESGDAERARAAHLAFYLALVEKALPELVGPRQGIWLAKLDLERENLLAAHAWCNRSEDNAGFGLRLVSAMRRYWMVRGQLTLGHRVTVEALRRAGAQPRTSARCAALFDAGQLGCWMGRYSEAQGYLQESLSIARELGDKKAVAVVLQPLAMASLGQGNLAAARSHLEEALVLASELGNKREIAAALNALAQVCRAEGDLDSAEPLYQNVLALARELDDREIIAIGLLNLAMVSIGRGSAARAREALLEALSIAEEIGSKPTGQSALDVCSGLCAVCEDWRNAARLFGAAEAQTGETGLRRDPADEAFLTPLIAEARAALGEAAFAAAEHAGRALTYEQAIEAARALIERPG
ncbi:MAG TPA: tetratricopeptide repeat protein [Casimicrobiaceae bacterium]|nr:tetratricopeptide repeat protein [Casimicrobiaceae bacterium]